LAHPVRQYRVYVLTNAGSVSNIKHNLTYCMGQRLSSKLLFISSPNTNGFCRFYISQGSATTQLRCAGKLTNHFITNFPRNAPVKKVENRPILDIDMAKSSWLTFWGPPCRLLHLLSTAPVQTSC